MTVEAVREGFKTAAIAGAVAAVPTVCFPLPSIFSSFSWQMILNFIGRET